MTHLLDWTAYLLEDMTTSTRINAFLWNRVSQGYSRVVKDKPPFESWRAWRAGHRDHKPMPYLTPVSSPAHEVPSELDDGLSAAAAAVAAVAVAEQAMTPTQGSSSSSDCGVGGGSGAYVVDTGVRIRTAVVTAAPPMQSVATAAAAAESARTIAGPSRGVGFGRVAEVAGNGDEDEDAEELEYEDVNVLTADLTGPPNSRRWGLPCPSSSSSSSSQQSQLSLDGGSGRSMTTMSTSTGTAAGSQGRLRENQISFKYNAPEDLALAVIHCTFTKRMEDVKNSKHVPSLSHKLTYGCHTLNFSLRNETGSGLRGESLIRLSRFFKASQADLIYNRLPWRTATIVLYTFPTTPMFGKGYMECLLVVCILLAVYRESTYCTCMLNGFYFNLRENFLRDLSVLDSSLKYFSVGNRTEIDKGSCDSKRTLSSIILY